MDQSTIRRIGNIIAFRNGIRFKNYLPKYQLAFSLYLIKYLTIFILLLIVSFSPIIGFMWWTDYINSSFERDYRFPIAIASLILFIAFLILIVKSILRKSSRTNRFEKYNNRVRILWIVIRAMPKYISLKEIIMDNFIKETYLEIKEIIYDDMRKSGKKTPDEINAFIMKLRSKQYEI